MSGSLSGDKASVKQAPKKIGIVMRHAPYGNNLAHEALDAALATSIYGQKLTLIFMGDGVFQLLHKQEGSAIHQKNLEKQMAALEFYDIEQIFVYKNSLDERQLKQDNLAINVTVIENSDLRQLLHKQDALLSF